MPKYTEDDAARAKRSALAAAQLIAAAELDARQEPALFPPPLNQGRSVAAAMLLILTADEYYRAGLVQALQEVRVNVLVVSAGSENNGALATYFSFFECRAGKIAGHGPLRLWASPGKALHLVPDPAEGNSEATCLCVTPSRVWPAPSPWSDRREQRRGIQHGEQLLRRDRPEGF